MNKKAISVLSVGWIALSGCTISEQQFNAMQLQVQQLQQKVNLLENQVARNNATLATTTGELAIVKEQRVVRLPTGAPVETRQRQTAESRDFELARQQYQSGDVAGGMAALSAFINRYPSAIERNQAIFYLGQAAYTLRDYSQAQRVLEPLVFQPTNGQVNESAAKLLIKVYQAQGNTADGKRVEAYLRAQNQSQQQSALSKRSTPNTPTPNSMIPSSTTNNQPLRPQLLGQ